MPQGVRAPEDTGSGRSLSRGDETLPLVLWSPTENLRATFSIKVRVMEKKPNKFLSQLFHATGACGQDGDPQDSNSHYSSGRWRKLS